MKLFTENKHYKLYEGNMLDMLEIINPNSIDSIVTDPPYELNFMNKGWDNSGIAFQKGTWEKCYEALKPGGYLLAFGGSRTFHRIACAIEDAGFEIRDVIMWLYGTGFPKSMNLGKAVESKLVNGSANTQDWKNLKGSKVQTGGWGISTNSFEYGARPSDYSKDGHLRVDKVDYQTEEAERWEGWGTALKPAYEPIIVARKPCDGSCVDNVLKYGVGGINIDECRIGNELIKGGTTPNFRAVGKMQKEISGMDKLSFGQISNAERIELEDHLGRFPSNVILTYDDTDAEEVCSGMPETQKESVARYFYCAKASKKDRDEGLDDFETHKCSMMASNANIDKDGNFTGMLKGRETVRKNTHPTVKPTSLMQYLVRLVTPKGGTILDPFNGSGSTGKATMYENVERDADYKYIGIELTKEYLPIADARIKYPIKDTMEEPEESVIPATEIKGQISIYDFI